MKEKLFFFLNWFIVKPKIISVLLFSLLITSTLYVSSVRQEILRESEENKMNLVLKDIHENIEKTLRKSFEASFLLELQLDDNGIPQNFNAASQQLLKENSFISALAIAPAGIVKYAYPRESDQVNKNLYLFNSVTSKEKQYNSINNNKTYLEGPLQLNKGRIEIIVKRTVFIKNKFWGFTLVVIPLNSFLKTARINTIDSLKYDFQFSRKDSLTNKELFFLPHQLNRTKDHFVSYLIPNSGWKLYIIAKKPYEIYPLTYLSLIMGLFLSLLIAYLTNKLLKKPQELQLLVNHQYKKIKNDRIAD